MLNKLMSFFYSLIGTIIYSYILTKIEIIILNIPIMFLGIVIGDNNAEIILAFINNNLYFFYVLFAIALIDMLLSEYGYSSIGIYKNIRKYIIVIIDKTFRTKKS